MPDLSQMAGTPLPAPELAPGTVAVRLMREQLGNNIVGHPVTLRSGATTNTAKTDAQGRATFTDVPVGTPVTAVTTVDGEELQSREFAIPSQGGIRVALIAGLKVAADRDRAAAEAAAKEPARPGIVVFGGESRIIAEFQDDNLQVFYILDIVNNARTPIDPGAPLVIELPSAAAGPGLMQGSSPRAKLDGRRLTITGPFPPGPTAVQVGYMVPYSSNTITLEQSFPATFEQVFAAVEKVGDLKMSSPQLPDQQEADANGTKFVMGRGPALNANQPLVLNFSSLPQRNHTIRNAGIGLALLVLVAGFWAAFSGVPPRQMQVAQLVARREKLYTDLTDLEEQRRSGRIDEKRYAVKRQNLVSQLERVLGELDHSPSGGGEDVAA